MIQSKMNVVVVLIAADGTISVTGPFISRQRADRWLTEHPEYGDAEGFQTSVERMDAP